MRRFFWAALFLAACSGPVEKQHSKLQQRSEKLNVIAISLDTLRPDHLGFYGYPEATSPFMDAMSHQMTCFSDCLAQVPSTIGSHRSIFLSKYLFQHGKKIPEAGQTLAGRFTAAGYQTAAFVDGGLMNRRYNNDAGFQIYDDGGGGIKRIRQKSLDWIKQAKDGPFFLFMHAYDIHCPYNAPTPYSGLFNQERSVQFETRDKCGSTYFNRLSLSPSDFCFISGLYDAGIRYCDAELAQFFRDLSEIGVLGKSRIVLFSDHGESLGERNYIGHNQLHDAQLRILFSILIPGAPARINADPSESIDIFPTLAHLSGISTPRDLAGIDLLKSSASGMYPSKVRARLSETHEKCIRTGDDWKLIIAELPSGDELYQLDSDPQETVNLASSYPDQVNRLINVYKSKSGFSEENYRAKTEYIQFFIQKKLRKLGRPAEQEESQEADVKLQEQLKRLGYVE
jgi:arylsulfatase A-like enzyme